MKKQTSASSETQIKDNTKMAQSRIDYSGKTIYVGIDVHQKDFQVAKVHNGITLGNHRMPADGDGVIKHLRDHYPGAAFECVYESCAWGFNLQRKLAAAGMGCIVVNAADVATNDKERKRKTDKVDALKLARTLSVGELRGIHIPEETIQKERNLIRYRSKLAGDINRSKNRLKSLLKYQGITIPDPFANRNNWSCNFLNWIAQQAQKDPVLGDTLSLMLDQLQLLRKLLLQTGKKLRQLRNGKYAASAKLATSVVGIGPTTAMMFLLEVGDVRRFKGFDALNDFIGFCPDTNSSGETDRDTGITSRRHKRLRSALVESAWKAITLDPALMDSYEKLCKRMKSGQAIIRIARKLLRRLRAVLITGTEYQKGIVA